MVLGAADAVFGREQRDKLDARFGRAWIIAEEVYVRLALLVLPGLIRDERNPPMLDEPEALL
jgi:hypothetical protein